MNDLAWRNSLYGEVYEALCLSLEASARNVRPGTEGVIARAIFHFRGRGEAETVAVLEVVALTISRLQASLRSGSETQYCIYRYELSKLARGWLNAAPMFPGTTSLETALAA